MKVVNPGWVDPAVGVDPGGTPSVPADHGILSGLLDDDHPQYLTQTRGDARYSLTSHLHPGIYSAVGHNHTGTYALLSHQHVALEVTDLQPLFEENEPTRFFLS